MLNMFLLYGVIFVWSHAIQFRIRKNNRQDDWLEYRYFDVKIQIPL